MATRFYLPASGAAPITLSAPASTWAGSTSFTQFKAVTTKSNTALASGTARTPVASGDTDRLDRVYISDPIPAQTISGTFSATIMGLESVTTFNAWLDIHIAVVSNTGSTVRGVLYAGSHGTQSSTVGAENEEFGTTASTRIKNALTLTSVTAQANDRIVIEVGYADNGLGTTNSSTITYGDPTATSDWSLTSGQTGSGDPWVELSQDVFNTSTNISLADTGSGADSVTVQVTAGLADTGTGADSLTATAATIKSLTDTGTGSDSLTVAVPVVLTDSGTGADSLTAAIQTPISDTGTGTDALTVTVAPTKPLTDTGTGAETLGVTAQTPLADSGTGTDSLGPITATVPLADTGTGVDSFTHTVWTGPHLTGQFSLADRASTFTLTSPTAGMDLVDIVSTLVLQRET